MSQTYLDRSFAQGHGWKAFISTAFLFSMSILLLSCGGNSVVGKLFATATPTATPTPLPTPTPAGLSPEVDLLAAIDAAADGDTITLAPGVFSLPHGFTLEKSLTLIGAGADHTTLTSDTKTDGLKALIAFQGSGKLILKNLTLAYTGQSQATVLYANKGAIELDGVALVGATLGEDGAQLGSMNLGGDVQVQVRNSQIVGNSAGALKDAPNKVPGGIYVYENAKLTVEDSQFSEAYRAIYAMNQASVEVKNNSFENVVVGVSLVGNSTATIEGNTFSNIKTVSIGVGNDAKASILSNTIQGGLDSWGILGSNNGAFSAENNQISGIKQGIVLMDQANAQVNGNTLHTSSFGLYASNESMAVFGNNILSGDDTNIGIMFTDGAKGSAEGNSLTKFNIGINVDKNSAPALTGNTISDCTYGISYLDNAAGSASRNIINALQAGISISSPAHPSLTDNTISAEYYGIITDPESWLASLENSGNTLQVGPPIVEISTYTPVP